MANRKLRIAVLIILSVLVGATFFVAHGLTAKGSDQSGKIMGSVAPFIPATSVKPVIIPHPVPTTEVTVQTLPASRETTLSLTILGKSVDLTGAPIVLTSEGKAILPLRKLGEALGYSVKWDNGIKAAVLEKNTESVLVKMDSAECKWGATIRVLSRKPEVISNRLYVPVDFISDNPTYLLSQTAEAITIDAAGVAAKQVLTGEIEEVAVYTNGLGLDVTDNKKASVRLYVTEKTQITHYSTGDAIPQSELQTGTKAIFSYTEVPDEAKSTHNILNSVEVVLPASR